ncbi:MAG: ABC transporter ATP-binding protein [Lachnospiraceae bacterium]|nr:ABC transporter ATP-binding protein [Lachnospiraceae bacterium]
MKLTVEHLCFSYEKEKSVLKDITFCIEGQGVTVLLGRNGSGKSTLLDCLIGYRRGERGSIWIDGEIIGDYRDRELARKIAYIPQKISCKMNYRVYEYILLGRTPYIRLGRHPSKEDCRIVAGYMDKCGITHLASKGILQLSGGEMQLVSMARALVQETPFLFLDEPFSALDLANQSLVMRLIRKIGEEKKRVLLTSHNPNHAFHLKSSVLLMKDGKILEHGRAEDIICVNKLRDIYGDHLCLARDLPYNEVSFQDK